jgi:hypothetical protein
VADLDFKLPDDADPETAVAALAAGLATSPEEAAAIRQRYFDTFDWRLHRGGLALVHEDDTWRLRRLVDDAAEAEAPAAGETWPRFARDFPAAGGLRRRLARLLKVRAVIHLATVVGERRSWRVLNADDKTVLRVELLDLRPERARNGGRLRVLSLRPVRGYDAPVVAAREQAATLGLEALAGPPLDAALEAAGVRIEGYSSRFRAELGGDLSSLGAAVVVGRTLLDAMRRNEAGLRQDIDSEFLHDFRVAVRRLRSALAIFGEVFDPAAVEPFRGEFAALGRLTGPLRDLDVYLLDEGRYRGLLPTALAPGLDPLFADLRLRREAALAEVRYALDSPAYRDLTRRWSAFLAAPSAGPLAGEPVSYTHLTLPTTPYV